MRAFRQLQPALLPGSFPELLKNGQLFTALVLATNFSEKYKGKQMQKGAVAEVKLPEGLQVLGWSPTLWERYGIREATPFIWFGDAEKGDRTLYVAFGPLRNKRQYFKLLSQGTHLVDDLVESRDGNRYAFRVSGYMKRLLDFLWSVDCNFGADLAQVSAEHPELRIMFSGISHGAALAQAAALRFALQQPSSRRRVFVSSFNAYKWTDEHGQKLANQFLGDRLLPLVLSSRTGNYRRWDSVPEFPPGLAPMPGSMLLDMHSGALFGNLILGDARANINFGSRLMELHFAKAAIAAVKVAMERDRTGKGTIARRRWQAASALMKRTSVRARLLGPHVDEQADYFGGETLDDGVDGDSDDEVQTHSHVELVQRSFSLDPPR